MSRIHFSSHLPPVFSGVVWLFCFYASFCLFCLLCGREGPYVKTASLNRTLCAISSPMEGPNQKCPPPPRVGGLSRKRKKSSTDCSPRTRAGPNHHHHHIHSVYGTNGFPSRSASSLRRLFALVRMTRMTMLQAMLRTLKASISSMAMR